MVVGHSIVVIGIVCSVKHSMFGSFGLFVPTADQFGVGRRWSPAVDDVESAAVRR